ncbi:MAG: hypothetical protein UX09_C0018G0013 [Candidatus Uhrbacteria bacterium GW2011_GWE2_45_35]|uniref:Uncharacterized protein n=2 Tax=Candidatus Uhriibacteriota TaxID=1752732 RepID=A0A0G1MIB0_9BACT|nr:MAG: hypothetical protein UW63_C0010G0005 [Candidatus Uhrbacteria bacterium GW2011_GWF2_44_350]KKU08386.1 MAG: hypothetical protein UX09_C0018G0013 [Candidatus Uhrbacteria bacterium GW2011_GWE2_45_35]HBR80519.1 hypothetical protein [Candidatus Uhrbacteria bacterium]HCU31715.1 hypothetical protein [Candidatus Uhrbacteria bacterium]
MSETQPDAWNKNHLICKDVGQPEEARRQALCEMLRLAHCYRYAVLTMRQTHDLRRPNNPDDTELLGLAINKVRRDALRVRGLEEAWMYAPDAEFKTAVLEQMEAIANEEPEQAFDYCLFVVEHIDDIAEDENDAHGARNDLINAITDAKQAHVVLKRLEDHPDLRPGFWLKMPRILQHCHEALILHHNWLTEGECEDIQLLIASRHRDKQNCPVNYRGICQNADCPLSGANRRKK